MTTPNQHSPLPASKQSSTTYLYVAIASIGFLTALILAYIMAPSIPTEQNLIGFDGSKTNGKDLNLIAFQAPVPTPNDDQALVLVTDSALNPVDWKLGQFNFGQRKDKAALGLDFAGQVVAVGKNVTHLKVGDDAFGYLNAATNGAWSSSGKGGYAVVGSKFAVKRDPQFPAEAAGTYAVAYLSAWDGVQNNLKEGQSVYIPGVAGGVAHFAVQIAKTKTDKVISSASRPETEAVAKQLNVPSFNYKTADVESEVKKHCPEGAHFIFDANYQASSYVSSAKALAPGGKLVILGVLPEADSEAAKIVQQKGGQIVQADLRRYWVEPEKFKPSFLQQGLEQAQQWYIEGKVRPIISKSIKATVEELQRELENVRAGKSLAKVAVKNVY